MPIRGLALTRDDAEDAVLRATQRLLDRDGDLLRRNVAERTLTGLLGRYLQDEFADLHVDCEYNRNGRRAKTARGRLVYPDVIVHQRPINDHNGIAIEAKKTTSAVPDEEDFEKLRAYRDDVILHYSNIVFVKFTTRRKDVGVRVSYGSGRTEPLGQNPPPAPRADWYLR
jgi:hypothetical protein